MAVAMVYILSAVAAVGVIVAGVYSLLDISKGGYPGSWTFPIVTGWLSIVAGVGYGLFRFSDRIVYTMRTGQPRGVRRRLAAEATEAPATAICDACGAIASPGATYCLLCGSASIRSTRRPAEWLQGRDAAAPAGSAEPTA